MASLPPQAAGLYEQAPVVAEGPRIAEAGLPAAATTQDGGRPRPGRAWEPRVPPVKPSGAQVELSLDLRGTPPDKVLARVFGALERVSDDVTLIVLVRDTPEFVGVVSAVFNALRERGYSSDTSRFPPGVQRLRIFRRTARRPGGRPTHLPSTDEPVYVPPPERPLPDTFDESES